MLMGQTETRVLFTVLIFMLICAVIAVLILAMKFPKGSSVVKVIVVLGLLSGLVMFPIFMFTARVSYQSASDVAVVEPIPPIVAETPFDDSLFDLPEAGNLAPSQKAAPVGEIIYGGSATWSHEFANSHVADVYSSEIEATKSLARQAAARLSKFKKGHSGISVAARFEKDEWSPEVVDAFMQTFRAHADAVNITQGSNGKATHVVELRMKDRAVGTETTVKTYLLPFKLPHDREETNLTAKFVNSPWVTNAVDFRTSESVPERYLIAVGEMGGDPNQAPLNVVLQKLSGRILQHLNVRQFHVRDVRVTERIVDELINEQFVQNFVASVDGNPVPQIVTVEAYLLDISNARLNQAINKVVSDLQGPTRSSGGQSMVGLSVAPGGVGQSVVGLDGRSSTVNRSANGAFWQFALFSLLICGVLKGAAWSFDRKRVSKSGV